MERIKIGDACELLNGFAFKSENYVDAGIRVIRIANVQKGYIEDNTPAFYPADSEGLDKYMLEENDLLMSLTGNVGRVAILQKEMLPAALNQRVACLRLKTDIISKGYLFHILNSDFFEQKCIQSSKGVAQKNMSTEWLKEFSIPVYPEDQQKEITTILDYLRDIIDKRKQELYKLDELIKARFVELFGDPVNNSKSFIKEELGSVCTKITDGTHDTPERYSEGFLLITGKNIRASGIIFDDVEYVSEEDHKVIYARCNPEYEDVLYTNIGVNYGTACLNDLQYEFSMKNVALLKPDKNRINGYYLWICLNLMRDYILRMNQVGGAQTFMGLATIKKIVITIPPVELQNRFIDFVKQVDKSKLAVKKALNETQVLFDSLMQKYFG